MKFGAVLFFFIPIVAMAQNADIAPTGFKTDHLGMMLLDFKAAHHDPGYWIIGAGGKKQWKSGLQCNELSRSISTCFYNTTIAEVGANASDTFLDGRLFLISVSFRYSSKDLRTVQEALQSNFGSPVPVDADKGTRVEPAEFWDHDSFAVQLQPHVCVAGVESNLYGLSRDVAVALDGKYCVSGQSLSYAFSRVVYLDKKFASVLPKRLQEETQNQQKKANGDL